MLPHHHNGAAAAMAQQPQYHQHPHFFGAPAQQQFAMHDGGNMHMLQQQHQQQQQQQHHQPAMMPQYQHQQQQHHLQQAQQYQNPYQHAPFSMSSMSTTSGPVYSSVIAGPSQPLQQWSGLNVDPNITATASVSGNSGNSGVPDWQSFGAEDDADMTGDMSNMGDDGEDGDGEKGKTFFACTHCDKSYRGKHARSIWRRHLQDKHGIPLSIQPRRTRWDADANRPKNAEERRERMLESKRRWARKKRAADKIEAKKAEAAAAGASADVIAAIGAGSPCSGDEENSPALGRGSALPAVSPKEPPQPLPQPQSQPPVLSQSQPQPQPALVHPQALFDGNSMRPANGNINGTYSMVSIAPGAPPHFIDDPTMNAAAVNGFCPPRSSFPPSTSTLVGAFASPLRAMPARRGVASPAPALGGVTTPSRPMAPSAAMTRSSSGNNPFSLDHHRISPIAQRTKVLNPLKVLTDNSPSRLAAAAAATSAGANRPSTSSSSTSTDSPKGEGSGAASSMRRVLPPLVGTPMRPSMIRDGVVDSMFLYGSSDRAAGRNSVTRMAAKRAKRNASAGGLSDEENDERGVDDRDRISSPVVKGGAANGSAARRRGAARRKVSSADEGDLLGSKRGAGVGAGDDDDDDTGLVGSFPTADDSGIYMPDFTPFHKSIGRAAGLGGAAIGMTPGPLMDGSGAFDSLAFPRTVCRPTPSTRNRRRKDDGNSSGSEDAASAAGPLGRGGRRSGDQFSSPHHPNLASSLGLAPQSALRSSAGGNGAVGSAVKTRSSSGSGASLPLYASSTPFAASTTYGLSGMSLGFTPFGSKGSSSGGGLPGIPSPAGSLLWPDSVRVSSKKRASGNSSAAGRHGSTSMMRSSSGDDLIGDTPSLSSGSKRARAAAAAGKAGPAKVQFSSSSSSDDEIALGGGSGSGSGKAQQASQRSGQAESDDDDEDDDEAGQNLGPGGGRYRAAVDETPSRPPALRGLSRRKGKSIDEEDEEEEEEDDGDRGALKPLRFNAAAV